ncbi:hypothetical protein Poli38472_004385 [Pythium oligandrum]|uniref:polynucleotide adenylyltransferase n=1 Tax=Pythium oligandrum TaxID=41045 RepID=A0A8K1C9T2_PYTOL|nr:hypothetical protein Poli38472_004385 [Pythium oligandrum]|eukprot:TMW59316.1 hypothetical protein Poli38472_004385 [Pythium oligandrum]
MVLRKQTKATSITSAQASTPAMSFQQSNIRNTSTPSSSPEKKPAPLSWKEAVERVPPPQPIKNDPKKASHLSNSSNKLARSRSVSRIVQSSRKRCEMFPGTTDTDANSTEASRASVPTPLLTPKKQLEMIKKSNSGKQVSFAPTNDQDEESKGAVDASLRSKAESRRFADLVNRLGLNDTQQMLGGGDYKAKNPMIQCHPDGRPRSASADSVLLRRLPPMWVFTDPAIADIKSPRGFRKDRSMSVPDSKSAVSSSMSHDVEKDSTATSEQEERVTRLMQLTKNSVGASSEEDSSELDCDDTHSESTSDSSFPSPRHGPLTTPFGDQPVHRIMELEEIQERASLDDMDIFSDYMTPEDEEEDYDAFLLLDRINTLSAEFKANREYEESSALAWSVQHAARQGVIPPQLQQNLLANIRLGAWEEARDVLYHKCHLVPAVGSVLENPNQPPMDSRSAESFLQAVEELAPTDSSEARHQKLRVLKLLSDLLTKWVKIVAFERGLPEEHIALTSGSLFLAGSYRLGLNDPVADIDAVCVVPYHVTHEDFFSSFCRLLEQTNGVSHLAPVPNAYVPLISLSYLGVSIDLLCARLPMTGVEPHQEIDSDHILVGVDPTSMKSLNAPRVSSMLLCLVPRRHTFRIVLRAVRAWARRRGIYSAKLGYLGGISWAILVAFVCQMYPDAEPAKVFVRFFQVFSEWQWPRPIMLNMVYDAGLGFEMWDPRQNLYDRAHIMPIITPAYPHMNSAVQVSQSTFSVIYEELWRARYLAEAAAGIARPMSSTPGGENGYEVSNDGASSMPSQGLSAVTGPATTSSSSATSSDWDKLFQHSNFFIRYDMYLVVNFYAETASSMHVWGKFVQSRLRKLVDSLQHVSPVSRVHAFPCYFPNTSDGSTPGSCMFIGVEFHSRSRNASEQHGAAKDDPEVKSNLERTIRFFLATDLQQLAEKKQDMCANASLLKWEELPEFVFQQGRVAALVERAEYHQDMERMTMLQSHGMQSYRGGDRYSGGGKWRGPGGGGPRGGRYYGGKPGGGKPRFRDGGHKPYFMAQAG